MVAVLRSGGTGPEHIIRMTWYVTDKREYLAAGAEVGKAYRELIGNFNVSITAVQVVAGERMASLGSAGGVMVG